jgi:hypothetical protein
MWKTSMWASTPVKPSVAKNPKILLWAYGSSNRQWTPKGRIPKILSPSKNKCCTKRAPSKNQI